MRSRIVLNAKSVSPDLTEASRFPSRSRLIKARAGISESFSARSAITSCHPRESGDPASKLSPRFRGDDNGGNGVTVNRRSCFVSGSFISCR